MTNTTTTELGNFKIVTSENPAGYLIIANCIAIAIGIFRKTNPGIKNFSAMRTEPAAFNLN
ncbi:MAG TPA: hypothetical protein VEA37_03140 [Flavobacterium sp.]|nr:hypothetical protein [Flavobacterium sp.]